MKINLRLLLLHAILPKVARTTRGLPNFLAADSERTHGEESVREWDLAGSGLIFGERRR